LWAGFGANRNCLTEEVDVAVAIACIYTVSYHNLVTIISIVNCSLNVVKVGRTIVVDIDSSRLR
jgi:hypothetical protein